MLFLNAAPDSCCAERPLHIPTYPRLVSTTATVREKTCGHTKPTNRPTDYNNPSLCMHVRARVNKTKRKCLALWGERERNGRHYSGQQTVQHSVQQPRRSLLLSRATQTGCHSHFVASLASRPTVFSAYAHARAKVGGGSGTSGREGKKINAMRQVLVTAWYARNVFHVYTMTINYVISGKVLERY